MRGTRTLRPCLMACGRGRSAWCASGGDPRGHRGRAGGPGDPRVAGSQAAWAWRQRRLAARCAAGRSAASRSRVAGRLRAAASHRVCRRRDLGNHHAGVIGAAMASVRAVEQDLAKSAPVAAGHRAAGRARGRRSVRRPPLGVRREIIRTLVTVTLLPPGRDGSHLNPESVRIEWKDSGRGLRFGNSFDCATKLDEQKCR